MSDPEATTPAGNPESVPELTAAAQAGDLQALAKLFELHENDMLSWARRRLGVKLRTLDETRDILHDAYQVVMRKIGSFKADGDDAFGRWLRGIITRVVLQKAGSPYLRKKSRLETGAQPKDLDLTPMTRVSLDEIVAWRWKLLRAFPRQDRLIYRLRLRGWSGQEIADRLGITDRSVRQHYAKTEAALRMKLMRLAQEQRP